eukprot:c15026_g1_i2 orf=103-393(-)
MPTSLTTTESYGAAGGVVTSRLHVRAYPSPHPALSLPIALTPLAICFTPLSILTIAWRTGMVRSDGPASSSPAHPFTMLGPLQKPTELKNSGSSLI